MRRFLLFALAATLFVACTKDAINEPAGIILDDNRTLTVSFEGDTEDTRIQLNEEKKSVWTEGDLLSVFYRSTTNEQWQFAGKTGDRTGNILPVGSSVVPTPTTNEIVVVYPYNAGYFYNSDTKNVQASLPAEQSYLKDGYGLDGNVMVSQSEYNQVSLKSVCGWLKLQLTGAGETVKSITLRGNAGEQVAGELYINTADATSTLASELTESDDDGEVGGTLVRPGTILTEVTLNCGAGVALDAEATAFYIALPPMTFTKGITVEITDTTNFTMTQSTDKEVVIERNHIKPMAAFKFVNPNTPTIPTPANNEIWYTATAKVEPYYTDEFGATYLSNVWDSKTGKGVITFDGNVTKIGYYAFYDCYTLTSVTIPDSVTTIGERAFYDCYTLTSVTIPDSVTTIGEEAFEYCDSLTSVTIPDSVTTIGDDAFSGCGSLTSVTIGNGVTTIGNYAFYECGNLLNVTIGDSVTTIGDYAFYECGNLLNVTIPDSVTTIGYKAFCSCDSLLSMTIGKGVTSFGSGVFAGCTGELIINSNIPSVSSSEYSPFYNSKFTKVTIGDSVTTIGDYAFYNCVNLTSVTIGNSVTTIGDWAFCDCDSLASVTIPDSVTTIGDRAFNNCTSLASVTIPDSVTTIGYSAFDCCFKLTSVTIGNSVTTIGESAFARCSSLTSVIIPDSVTTIGERVFSDCDSLTSVTIPDSVTTIGEGAFCYCPSLTNVNIPDSVTTIGESAFGNCWDLTSVTIGNSVTTIGERAFYKCTSLKTVYCKPTTPPAGGSYMFYNNAPGRKILVPASADDSIISAYKAAEYWSDYASNIFEEE
mgnify:CR=1 FL=1